MPDDIEPHLLITGVGDLEMLRDLLADDAFRQELIVGFGYGPCRSLEVNILGALGMSSGASPRAMHGQFMFGDPAVQQLYRIRFFYFLGGRAGAQVWSQSMLVSQFPPDRVIIPGETSLDFLSHVLDLLPQDILDPLADGPLVGIQLEEDWNTNRAYLRLRYHGQLSEQPLTASADILGSNPVTFGPLEFE